MNLRSVEDAIETKWGAYSLSQNELPVLGAQRSHHDAKYVEEGAESQKILRASVIVDKSYDRPRKEHHEYLQRGYPGYCTGRIVAELVRLIVLLEY